MAVVALSLLLGVAILVAVMYKDSLAVLIAAWLPSGRTTISKHHGDPSGPTIQVTEDEARNEARKNAKRVQDGILLSSSGPPTAFRAPQRPEEVPRLDVPTDEDKQTTPKASAAQVQDSVPEFSLDVAQDAASKSTAESKLMPPPPKPFKKPEFPQILPPYKASSTSSSTLMPHPPPRIPTLNPVSPGSSLAVPRGPVPSRGRPNGSPSLAPPPSHSTKPAKPSRQVILTPGHSPLDWARLTSDNQIAHHPTDNLRGLPPATPYLRVSPSQLKQMTGRKGKPAWSVFGGKVYNITPYIDFHPGGGPELLRGAGKDGTKLFAEVHPWVNYETMLSACLVGMLVDELDPDEGKMDEMD